MNLIVTLSIMDQTLIKRIEINPCIDISIPEVSIKTIMNDVLCVL